MRRDPRAIACILAAAIVAVSVVVAAGFHFERDKHEVLVPRAASGPAPSASAQPSFPPLEYLGVYEPTSPGSYSAVSTFAGMIGRQPNIAVYYSSWWEPFQLSFAQSARAHGALPMVQIEPSDVSLAAIADGYYDSYLRSYASAVRDYGGQVILAFGHEMNANWYGWGYQRTSPAVFVQAWRHVHDVFAAAGARNVIWLWAVNVVGSPQVASSISQWWPGSGYVNWAGIDGHYFNPSVDFAQLFGATLGQIRRLTKAPLLVSEAGIAPDVSPERITDLFAGARAHGMIGVVWFDVTGHNIRVEGDPPALAAFRTAVARYTSLRVAAASGP